MYKENEIIVGVKGIIVRSDKILIVQRSQQETGGGSWECPGGKINFGEQLETALIREIKEETDLTVKPGKLMYASTFMSRGTRQMVLLCYLAEAESEAVTLSHEHIDFCWADEPVLRRRLPKHIIHEFEQYKIFSLL